MRQGNLFIVSGPSGAGKGTLVGLVMDRIPDAWLSISVTTRQPREGEVDGVHYFFVDDERFDGLVSDDGLLEWAQVHSARYGTPRKTVEDHIAAGGQVILEIDVQGAFQVREKVPAAHLVFIEPPSLEELEDEASIVKRMENARIELSRKMEYDIQLVNDNLDECTEELVAFIESKAEKNED